MRRLVLAAGVFAALVGVAQAQDARSVVRTVQFFPANDSLGEASHQAISTTARTLMSARHAGCRAPCIRLDPGLRVTVVGHAFHPVSEDGGVRFLSQIRAMKVRDVLVQAGVPTERVWTLACGDAVRSAGPSTNDERVEIIVEPEAAQPTCG